MGFSTLLGVADEAVRDVLGQEVVYTPGVGSPVSIQGIFDATYIRVDDGTPGISSSSPAVFVRLADLPSDPESDLSASVTVATIGYSIHEARKDGTGAVVLILRLQ